MKLYKTFESFNATLKDDALLEARRNAQLERVNESNKYSVEYSDGMRGSSEFKRQPIKKI